MVALSRSVRPEQKAPPILAPFRAASESCASRKQALSRHAPSIPATVFALPWHARQPARPPFVRPVQIRRNHTRPAAYGPPHFLLVALGALPPRGVAKQTCRVIHQSFLSTYSLYDQTSLFHPSMVGLWRRVELWSNPGQRADHQRRPRSRAGSSPAARLPQRQHLPRPRRPTMDSRVADLEAYVNNGARGSRCRPPNPQAT